MKFGPAGGYYFSENDVNEANRYFNFLVLARFGGKLGFT